MPDASPHFADLLDAARRIATDVAAQHAVDVDANARFPHEAIAAARHAKLLSAAVPAALGGAGCSLLELAQLCGALARGCSASGMVLAMHTIEVGCIARHTPPGSVLARYLETLCHEQYLLGSMTSEVGVGGDIRTSQCAVERDGDRYSLTKHSTASSYAQQADGILVTARAHAAAGPSEQVVVLARKEDFRLDCTGAWDTLGMRGTCSPGFVLQSSGPADLVVPEPFARVASRTMVPFSHVLWAAVWSGIAADAMARAAAFVRAQARRSAGTLPPTAPRLADALVDLQTLQQHWQSVAAAFDATDSTAPDGAWPDEMHWALRLNNLKVSASDATPRIVHKALQIIGLAGYRNEGAFSVGRQYRDVLSASLMVANERINAGSAAMLMVLKDVT